MSDKVCRMSVDDPNIYVKRNNNNKKKEKNIFICIIACHLAPFQKEKIANGFN